MTNFDSKIIAPGIYEYPNAFDNAREIVERAVSEREEEWGFATIYGNGGQLVDITGRNTQSFFINPTYNNDVFWWKVAQQLWLYGNDYAEKNNITFSGMENPQLLYYSAGEGFYKAHVDSSLDAPRIFSCMVYLNDVKEGGETYFNNFDIYVKPEEGKAAFFPANYAYRHEARMPISNSKFALVAWFRE